MSQENVDLVRRAVDAFNRRDLDAFVALTDDDVEVIPVGRRPLLAAGNSNGDIQMLDFAQQPDKPFLRLLVLHDDAEREFDYTSGAEQALDRADTRGWTIVSIKNDWATVFLP
jgi:ketosteroid isomerase-like protein